MSLFKKAAEVTAKPAAVKKTKQEIAMAGIQQLAEFKAMMVSLEAASKTIEADIKEAGFAEFLQMSGKVRPESFKGIDGQATCSVEMRKRGTNSALNEDEVETLKSFGLNAFQQVTTTEMFGINPTYASDEKLMDKVSAALEKIVPEDFFVIQKGVTRNVVDDALCDAAFQMPAGEDRATAVRMVTTMALKPKLNADYNMNGLAAAVASYLAPAEDETDKLTAEAVQIITKTEVEVVAKKVTKKSKASA